MNLFTNGGRYIIAQLLIPVKVNHVDSYWYSRSEFCCWALAGTW